MKGLSVEADYTVRGPLSSAGVARTSIYNGWRQVAGYFDGDGSVTVHVGKLVLDFGLQFTDNYRPQLEQLQYFLETHKVKTGNISKNSREMMHVLLVSDDASLIEATKMLLPFCFKKKQELEVLTDYMHNRITANAAIDVFNRLVTMGERTGKIRKVGMPFTHDQALKERVRRCGEATREKLSKLTFELQSEIQTRHLAGETARSLAAGFEVSETTIFKAIHGGYKELG
jgi:LAGLIDADG-like domain